MLKLFLAAIVILAPHKAKVPELNERYHSDSNNSVFVGYTLYNPLKHRIDAIIDCGDWYEPMTYRVKAHSSIVLEIKNVDGQLVKYCILVDYK